MAKQPQSFFLEEWLRSITVITSSKNGSTQSSTYSAQAIIQAWADLRDSLKHQAFHAHHLQALKILISSQAALHVADPQAKLLISILSTQSLSLPQESYSIFFRLLYIWVRKSRQSSMLVESAIDILLKIFSSQSYSEKRSLSEGILLLGALSYQTSASDKSKNLCLELLCKLLEKEYKFIFLSDELAASSLAGVGYALSSPVKTYFRRILGILLSIWGQEGGPFGISQGLMLLHLIEWVFSNSLNSRSLNTIDLVKELMENVEPTHSSFAVVMVAAGVLRAINRSGSSGFMELKYSSEERIEIVARDMVSATKVFDHGNQSGPNLLLQCIALALARSGSLSYRASLLESLALGLLTEAFPLHRIYAKVLEFPQENWEALLDDIKDHLNSFVFKEAGAITGVFCNQYASADEDFRSIVENLVWDYCEKVYLWHRQATALLVGRGDELIIDIGKIAESAFLMVVVFALGVTKHRLNSRINREIQLQISVKILVSFSCMEYFHRMRLPEYMDTIRSIIACVQENESASVTFIESMPSYRDLVNHHDFSKSKSEHLWSSDEVQTARMVFYMRVILTCVDRLPATVFKKSVAPIIFLYMGHPNGKVARYTHSVFVAFMSSGKDINQDDERVSLKEQLVFYYLQRSLEGYPGITPFEGMASGVAAIVRHLPAGSPSIFYCIHNLVEKATTLCSRDNDHESDMWMNWEGELEPSKKVLDLLIRLLPLVDIQVLPSLMKSLAQLIVQLPSNGQNMILNQLYDQIADSDDVIRKPTLVSWVQSLSYLCSQGTDRKRRDFIAETASVSLNGLHARL